MNPISNIWHHPRTSAAGLLIGIATVGDVLSRQGVGFGTAGKGTVVTLATGLAAALLGLMARDPVASAPRSNGTTARLGAWALIALLLPLPWMAGCSGTRVAQDIVDWTPALESAVQAVDSTAAVLDPQDAPAFSLATAGFDAASQILVAQSKAYLANPTASALALLQAQVVTLQQQVNASLLDAAKIVNPASQQHALASIQAVAAVVSAILALVQSVSSKAQVAAMAARSTIKLTAVQQLLDREQAAVLLAAHYREPLQLARSQVAQTELAELQSGL